MTIEVLVYQLRTGLWAARAARGSVSVISKNHSTEAGAATTAMLKLEAKEALDAAMRVATVGT